MVDLSIIIISFNTKKLTLDCLRSVTGSLKNASFSYEVIVWDNASVDGSDEAIEEFAAKNRQVILKKSPENLGFGRGNNRAVQQSKGAYLLFLNSDTSVIDNAIEKLLTYYKSKENSIQFLGGKLLNPDRSEQPSAGSFFTLPVTFAVLFLGGDRLKLTRYSPRTVRRVDWISGACILTSRAYFEAVGGFDEGIFMYMEEVDLLYRAGLKGMRAYFYPEARFIHYGSASSDRTYPVSQLFQGLLYFYRKYYPSHVFFLKGMLQLKAVVAIAIGKAVKNEYLIKTYEKALTIIRVG